MSKVALSREQLKEINNFLDAELASAGEDTSSILMGSNHSKKAKIKHNFFSPAKLANSTLNTQPVHELEMDRAEILSSDAI